MVYTTKQGKVVSEKVHAVAKIIASDAEGPDQWDEYVLIALRIIDKLKQLDSRALAAR